MVRIFTTLIVLVTMISPVGAAAQSGDASWLGTLDGLDSAIGRAWMGELSITEEYTETEYNEQGTPVHEISMRTEPLSTPVVLPEHRTLMLSIFVFQFDSEENAAAGLDAIATELIAQNRRDPLSPAVNEFEADLGDAAHGWSGIMDPPTTDGSDSLQLEVVYLMVQDGDLVYQVFGQFLPGAGENIASGAVTDMIATEPGTEPEQHDPNGGSTGGLWEKLNAVDVAFPEGLSTFDLLIWPMDPNAVQGETVVVPKIDLEHLDQVPGLTQGWHATYQQDDLDPDAAPEGVFNVELWVLEFENEDTAMAAAFSAQQPLMEPLGIISGGSSADSRSMEEVSFHMSGGGFVRDRSLPEGDAAYTIVVQGSTLVLVRVYANGPAPQAVAQDVVNHVLTTPASETPQDNDAATGGGWDRLPQSESDVVRGLPITRHQFVVPAPATPAATPRGEAGRADRQ